MDNERQLLEWTAKTRILSGSFYNVEMEASYRL